MQIFLKAGREGMDEFREYVKEQVADSKDTVIVKAVTLYDMIRYGLIATLFIVLFNNVRSLVNLVIDKVFGRAPEGIRALIKFLAALQMLIGVVYFAVKMYKRMKSHFNND